MAGNIVKVLDGTTTGAVQAFAGAATQTVVAGIITASTAPTGWAICDGSTLSRTTYALLFARLGGASSPWGLPDGSTFKLPDFRGVFMRGAGSQTISSKVFTGTLGTKAVDTTAKNGLTTAVSTVSGTVGGTTNAGGVDHSHAAGNDSAYAVIKGSGSNVGGTGYGIISLPSATTGTASAYSHSHAFTSTAGSTSMTAAAQAISGDAETAPANVGVNYIIRLGT